MLKFARMCSLSFVLMIKTPVQSVLSQHYHHQVLATPQLCSQLLLAGPKAVLQV